MIPTVPGTELVNTPTSGVKRDFNALNAPNRARMQLADTVADVGAQLGEFAQKLQAAKNFGIAADADREMRQASADFRESRRGRTDEENWLNEWKDTAQATREKIYSTHAIGPDLRRQLDQNFKSWDQTNAIEVKTLATKQAINRAAERISTAADDAAKDGDEQTINALFTGAAQKGIYYPEEADAMRKGYLNKIDQYAAKNYIDNFPVGATDYLSEKDANGKYKNLTRLDPSQRDRLMTEARQKMHAYQADNLDDLRGRLDSGDDLSEAFIKQREDRGEISARGAASLRAYIKGKGLAESKEEHQLLTAEVLTSDVTAMKDPQKWAADLKADAASLPTVYRNQLTRLIDNKLAVAKKQNATEEKPVEREIYARMKKDFDEGFMLPGEKGPDQTSGFLWWKKTVAPGKTEFASEEERKNWEFNQSPEARKAAALRYAQTLDQMHTFFEQHPKATQTEAEEFRQKLIQPYLMEQIGKTIQPPAPSGSIRVRSPDGKVGTIPEANRDKALKAGYSILP